MQPRHIVAGGVRLGELTDDLLQGQGPVSTTRAPGGHSASRSFGMMEPANRQTGSVAAAAGPAR
jgi:hypothetical protein